MTCRRNPRINVRLDPDLSKYTFLDSVEKKFLNAVKHNKLIRKNDKVLVAVSGGKDSMLLLRFMSSFYPEQTTALHVNQGIKGVSTLSERVVKKYCALWDVDYQIVSFRQEFKKDLDQMIKKIDANPCYLCGVIRRYLINKAAREGNYSKLATGHNLDDEAQSILMNIFMGDLKRQTRLGYSTGIVRHEKFVQRIKPLRDIYERETILYSMIREWKVFECNCPYAITSFRGFVRDLLDYYDAENPGTKRNIVDFYDSRILPKLKKKKIKPIRDCPDCGEPSSQEPCKTCQLLDRIR